MADSNAASRAGWVARLAVVCTLLLASGCAGISVELETGPSDPPGPEDGISVTIVEVVDGDTVDIRYENGTRETIRLLGVDTPEVYTENDPAEFEGIPDTEAGRNCLERWGEEASAFATERLANEEATLVFDPDSDRRGSYDRLLGYLYVSNTSFNYQLVETGHARVYESAFRREQLYLDAESAAQENTTGLWACRS